MYTYILPKKFVVASLLGRRMKVDGQLHFPKKFVFASVLGRSMKIDVHLHLSKNFFSSIIIGVRMKIDTHSNYQITTHTWCTLPKLYYFQNFSKERLVGVEGRKGGQPFKNPIKVPECNRSGVERIQG